MSVLRTVGTIFLALVLSACGISVIRGSGNILRENREIGNFERVLYSGSGELVIAMDGEESLAIIADERILPLITTEVRNETLFISEKKLEDTVVVFTEPIRYFLSVDDLTALAMDTPGSIRVEELISERLLLEAGGGGTIHINRLMAEEVIIRVGGVSTIEVAGSVGVQKLLLNESGTYEAPDLLSMTADVTMTDSGAGTIWVEETLVVKISGQGSLFYYGSPSLDVSGPGPGEVNSRGEK